MKKSALQAIATGLTIGTSLGWAAAMIARDLLHRVPW